MVREWGALRIVYLQVCVPVCVKSERVRATHHFFPSRLSTALNAQGTIASPGGRRARAHTHTDETCWCGGKSFRLGRATCRSGNVRRHMAGTWFEKNRTMKNHTRYQVPGSVYCFVSYTTEQNPTPRALVGRMCLSTATFGPCP